MGMAEPLDDVHELSDRIVVSKGVRFGRPVIRGTRVPVELVVGQLAGGMTVDQVMSEYALDRDDVLAALRYAADLLAEDQVRAS